MIAAQTFPGLTRDLPGPDEWGGAEYRSYSTRTQSELGRVPSVEDVMSLVIAARTAPNPLSRDRAWEGLRVLERTMTGSPAGSSGGFTLAEGLAAYVFDRARSVLGPWSLVNWRKAPMRIFNVPIVNESGRAAGKRWGGVQGKWGLSETSLPAPTDSTLGRLALDMHDLKVFTEPISRDLFADALMMADWLSYVSTAEIRTCVEDSLINGNLGEGGGPCPVGVVGHPATVTVTRTTAKDFTAANIQAMWAGIYAPCKATAVWHASDEAIAKLDALAVSGTFPTSVYLPMGTYGNPFALVQGRPLIPCESCNSLGNSGDLVCVDWNEYWLYYLAPRGGSSLEFNAYNPDAVTNRGTAGLPADAVEGLMSDQKYFDTDSLGFLWRLRADGNFLWTGTMTTKNGGGTVGPAAVLSTKLS